MRKSNFSFITLVMSFVLSAFFVSCDRIGQSSDKKDKQEQTEQGGNKDPQNPDDNNQSTQQEPEIEEEDDEPQNSEQQSDPSKSTVVALDFTGQNCGYCYDMIGLLKKKRKQFKPNLIVIAAHTGVFEGLQRFGTKEAAEYKKSSCSDRGLPTVMLNNHTLYEDATYDARLANFINKKPSLKLKLKAENKDGVIEYSFKAEPVAELVNELIGTKLRYVLLLVENKIKGSQTGLYTSHKNFVHNHVLRGSLNGVWGETCGWSVEYKGQKSFTANVKDKANCELIAIVLDDNKKSFINAVKVKL